MRVFRNRFSEKASGDAREAGGGSHPSVPDPLAIATERVGEVRRAAERARTDIAAEFAGVKRDRSARGGEATGRERLAEQLAGTLAERTAALAAEAADLAKMLARAEDALARAGGSPAATGPRQAAGAAPRRIELSRRRRFRREDEEQAVPEAARRLAAQMVVAGASPEEVSARLRREFGLENPDEVLGLIRA